MNCKGSVLILEPFLTARFKTNFNDRNKNTLQIQHNTFF